MMILVTGGSGSGKSAYAEERILSMGEGRRIYIATMFPFDEESRRRIQRHRRMRAEKKFTTIECYTDLKRVRVPEGSCVLLECMSNLAANEIFQENGAGAEHTADTILEGVKRLSEQAQELVIVTNEIFSDGITYDAETRTYQKVLGEINRRLAQLAGTVTEVVYGIPVHHKKQPVEER